MVESRGSVVARHLQHEIDIDAPASRVWEILTDTDAYAGWNPFVPRFEGELREGSRVKVWLKLYRWGTVPFRPVITSVVPNKELRWLAKSGPTGVFDVQRRFVIHEREGGGVRLEQGEVCTGFLTPLMYFLDLDRRIVRGYRRMNTSLKALAEAGTSQERARDGAASESLGPGRME